MILPEPSLSDLFREICKMQAGLRSQQFLSQSHDSECKFVLPNWKEWKEKKKKKKEENVLSVEQDMCGFHSITHVWHE